MRPVLLLAFALACSRGSSAPAPDSTAATTPARVREMLAVLAADSLEGRMTGERGSATAAAYIAGRMRASGLEPMGDSGWFQRVPLALRPRTRRDGSTMMLPALLGSFADQDTIPAERRRTGINVLGVLRGSDPALRDTVVLVDAHYDHLGIGSPVNGDSIYNGADDDASGTVAVLEIARILAAGPRPRRTVVFAAMTGEEVGLLGTRWYLAHPAVPLERMAANLEIEMIARPDSLVGGAGKAWLTGYERSTMGDALAAQGIAIVADPRPEEHFFERSDNIAFARAGIPAHTLSSFGLHGDYHTPADDVAHVDAAHMAAVVNAGARAVRLLADGPAPRWKEGGKP